MRVIEAIDMMSSSYLERVIKSFTKEYPRKDEDGYRDEIKTNIETLKSFDHVETRFQETFIQSGNPYSLKVLASLTIQALLSKDDYLATENEIIEFVKNEELKVLKKASDSSSLKHLPQNSETIFKAVLEVALEDQSISRDEMALIRRLRQKLRINEKDQYLILARLGHFPKSQNETHSLSEIKSSLNELQKCGLIFYCNQTPPNQEKFFVIPEEIVPSLKKLLNIELMESKYDLLLQNFNTDQLKRALKSQNLMVSGAKDELTERIVSAGIKPSTALNLLGINELQELASRCKGLKKSGTKQNKVDEIIGFFDNLITKDNSRESDDPYEDYYKYYEQLASRDEKNLLSLDIISKGKDVDNAFEYATQYLFTHKFGHDLIRQDGSDHCDGCIEFPNGELFMWDNKSLMQGSSYQFPEKHLSQFKRYIKDARDRQNKQVRCFLIISSEIGEASIDNAYKLKHDSGADTDVAVISANDLKEVAENWRKSAKDPGKSFNLEVFNYTGILDRETLKRRIKIFI